MSRARPVTAVRLVRAGAHEVEVHVRRSRRARRLRLWAPPRRPIELVVPWRAPAAAVDAFLAQSAGWLAARAEEATAPGALAAAGPGVAWLDGEPLPLLRVAAPAGARPRVRAGEGGLELRVPAGEGGEEAALAALERFYRAAARVRVEALVAREAPRLGVEPARVTIRDTTSRFGSCSTTGTLSFSWRLVLAPPEVLDYVVVHELCHLREHNHSPRFWALVEAARPGWRAQRDWLHEHGRDLLAWTPELPRPQGQGASPGGPPTAPPGAPPPRPATLPGPGGQLRFPD